MQECNRVVVTGLGVVCANAGSPSTFKDALYHSVSGISFRPELHEYGFACQVGGVPTVSSEQIESYFTKDEQHGLNEVISFASIAAIDAYEDAGLKIPDRKSAEPCWDTGAIIGTGIGGMDTISSKLWPAVSEGQTRRMGSAIVEQTMASGVSARIGGILGLGNQVTTNSSACATGTEAIAMASQRIRVGLATRMLAGGSEGTSPYGWAGFDSMRVLARGYNDAPERSSRPMSATAAGFVPSGGAGILVLETLESALERGVEIYAEISGEAVNSGGMRQGGSMTAPNSQGAIRCIRSAIQQAGISAEEVDYINGHLTATMADPIELMNWTKALAIDPKHLPAVNSTKSLIGHALGASGAIECVATILQMKHDFIHASTNCEDLHPDLGGMADSIVQETRLCKIRTAAKASFGFGDVNSCLIFQKIRAGQ